MRSAYAARIGGDDPLSNVEIGELDDRPRKAGDAVVEVHASTLNHHDIWTLQGVASRPVQVPQVLGCDASGIVRAYEGEPGAAPPVGSRVVVHSVLGCGACTACMSGRTHLCRRVGILSEPGYPGALSTELVVPAENLIEIPDEVAFETAACLPTAYLTAYHALFTRAGATSGDVVLIHGATGGVATAVMLLCQTAGIHAWVTSRSAEKGEAVVAAGLAEKAFVSDEAAAKAIVGATDGVGVDAIIDSVGAATWELSLKVLRSGGTLVTVGTTSGPNPPAQLNRIFWKHLTIAGSSMGEKRELVELVKVCAAGDFKPVIDDVVALEDVPAALRRLASGDTVGKIVVDVQ